MHVVAGRPSRCHGWMNCVCSLLQGPATAFPQRSGAAAKPVVPVARQPRKILAIVNPDTNEGVDLASITKEASKLQVRTLRVLVSGLCNPMLVVGRSIADHAQLQEVSGTVQASFDIGIILFAEAN